MKRRVLSLIIALALCLNLFPAGAFTAGVGAGDGLCPHHPAHTDECGYASPVLERECSHSHSDDCYTEETSCIHEHTAECYPEPDDASGADEPALCTHICTQEEGCVTQSLSCLHEHDDACGYAEGNPGAPCTFVCAICPIEDLISELPGSVSAHNMEQVQAQIQEIYALYDELSGDEQQQVDLSSCAALLDQIDGLGSAVWSDDSASPSKKVEFSKDQSSDEPFLVNVPLTIITNGHTLTGLKSSAIQVTGTGKLYLTGGGKIISIKGAGVEVQSGGFLSIADPDISVQSTTYALDIAADAEIHLSAGTYRSDVAAIRTADGDFAALLEPGYIFFDASGNRIPLENMAAAKEVTVGQCMDHSDKNCTHDPGTTTHTWTCRACGITELEPCTFTFQQDGTGTCVCGNGIEIVVDENDLTDLVYDGTIKPEDVDITVTLTDSSNQKLVKGTDYNVDYEPRKDAGEIVVTVTGITFTGTFTKTYTVSQDRPALEWDTTAKPVPVAVDYDGEPVEAGDLPPVKINILSTEDNLQEYLQYSHKKQGDADYTDGLPTNAGTYDVIVSLPEMQNFEAAVSAPITLTINQISPIITPPAAVKPVYNGAEQELVTAGTLDPAAIADGLEIKFATAENGAYSTAIPTGTNAGDYQVWYKVEVTDNYTAVDPTEITGVEIQRKQLTPDVTLSEYTYLYDNGYKEPKVTVKDGELKTILPETEYQFEYVNNRNVSTPDNPAKVIVTDKTGGNYDLADVEVPFQITLRTQEALSITEKPNTVIYGDTFTLSTSGGSGDGLVTWEIIAVDGAAVATVDQGGQVTIVGDGKATVKATKSGEDPDTGVVNYEDATATWTLTARKKPVTAIVTAENKTYDTTTTAIVHAVVEQ
ncbi:MAG: Ig-like domain-containing protein, partial [Lachnospiraceae bacterium]|nr:Ig-like domain-containing protein [Lachnospiraceae bacterium]